MIGVVALTYVSTESGQLIAARQDWSCADTRPPVESCVKRHGRLSSQNGITLNGEPCREGRLVHGDIVGMNKFLLRFSNQALEAPTNLKADADKPRANRPKDVQRTVHVDAEAAQQLAEMSPEEAVEAWSKVGEAIRRIRALRRCLSPYPRARR